MEDQKDSYDEQRKEHSTNIYVEPETPQEMHSVMRSPQALINNSTPSPDSVNALKRSVPDSPEDDDDDDDDDDDEPDRKKLKGDGKKKKAGGSGRRRIEIKFIENKSRRQVTFSRRKRGLMKKAYELTTLTGTQALVLIASETGHVYTFATPKLQPVVTLREGKELIQSCLNAPDTNFPPEYNFQQSQSHQQSSSAGSPGTTLPKPEPHSHQSPNSHHHNHESHMMPTMYSQNPSLPALHHQMGGSFHPQGLSVGQYGQHGLDHNINYMQSGPPSHHHPHLSSMVPGLAQHMSSGMGHKREDISSVPNGMGGGGGGGHHN
eukprot:TRINITY_DN3239_c0_g2_i1.p1 TRINITY_DN3239_c0_g2~~TRINITY_DN3239_c0_g2_i1.p1  ORF type:complete len:320 (+),score=60.59 TRINITY_DN3239_c0_g2_i1:196-1155(+)